MKKFIKILPINKINSLAWWLAGFGLFVSLLVVLFYFKLGRSVGRNGKQDDKHTQIIAFVAPALHHKMVEIAKEYSLEQNIKISLSFAQDNEIEGVISGMESSGASIALIGYPISNNEERSLLFGTSNIIGVTNNALHAMQDADKKMVFKNLCQLEKVLKAENLPVYISNGFSSTKGDLHLIYEKDCERICSSIASRVVSLTDVSSTELVKANYSEYVLVSKVMVPEMLLDGGFDQRFVFGLYFYIKKNGSDNLLVEDGMSNSAYSLVDAINSADYAIAVADRLDADEIREEIAKSCVESIQSPVFNGNLIAMSKFNGKDGVLIGLTDEIVDAGMTVYESSSTTPIWMTCRNSDDKACKRFLSFVVAKNKKS